MSQVPVRELAVGKWHGILSQLGIADEFLRPNKNTPCPACGGKDRFRWTNFRDEGRWICNHCGHGDGFDLLQLVNGWPFATAAKEVERIVGSVEPQQRPPHDAGAARRRIERIRAGLVPSHPDVLAYLESRGLELAPGLRAHPSVGYFEDGKRVADFPALVASIYSASGDLVSLHITYLQNGRKAPVAQPRKILPPISDLGGSAIRLYPISEHLGVAEGIETAISAKQLYGIPVWSVANATLMEKWRSPESVKRVTIFADKDSNFHGEKSAYALAFRLANAGLVVDVRVPPAGDFNDVLMARVEA